MENYITKSIIFNPVEGKEDELRALLMSLVEPSRNEAGCLTYDLYETEDGDFLIVETWENADYLEGHKTTDHFLNFKELGPDLIEDKMSESLTLLV